MSDNPSQKFYNEQHDRHGGTLHWPGIQGFPFRGNAVPHMRQHELDSLVLVGDFHFKSFDLSNTDDAEYYQWVRDRARNRLFCIDHCERKPHANGVDMVVYLEWTQFYAQLPPKSANTQATAGSNFTLR